MNTPTHFAPYAPPRGGKFSTCRIRPTSRPASPSPRGGKFSTCRVRPAFTLVELLVVIGIIALLAAIVTPAVMRAQATARNAAIKAEIDMLHMAIMNYKNEYGSFPPAISGISQPTDTAVKHIAKLFPRCTSGTAQLLAAFPASASPKTITATNAVSFWLSGYTDDPAAPLSSSGLTRKKLYDFDMSRIDQTTGAYFPSGKRDAPYLYLNSPLYSTNAYIGGTVGALRQTYAGDSTPFYNTGGETDDFFNPDTFQILCAGRDEEFGTDDDLSNFWPGTRRDYLDSLKQ